jgi:hypothetical protein
MYIKVKAVVLQQNNVLRYTISVKLSDCAINRLIILISLNKLINNICDAIGEHLGSITRIEAQPPSKFHKPTGTRRLKSKDS